MSHAVEQGQDSAVCVERRDEGIDRADQIVGLAAQENQIEPRPDLWCSHEWWRRQIDVAQRTSNLEAISQLLGARGAHQECDVAPSLHEMSAEIAADRSGAHDEYAHEIPPSALG